MKKKKKGPQISHTGIKTPNLHIVKEKQPRSPARWPTGSAHMIKKNQTSKRSIGADLHPSPTGIPWATEFRTDGRKAMNRSPHLERSHSGSGAYKSLFISQNMMELTVSIDWNFTKMKEFCLLQFFLTGWHHLNSMMQTLQIP